MFSPLPSFKNTEEELNNLAQALEASTKLKRGRSRKTTCYVSSTKQPLDSWKFSEWDYGKQLKGIILPCNARGLFIAKDNSIAVRGYDKFFNVDEVEATRKKSLAKTNQKYSLTLKENGCIIFISGDKHGNLIVCSKHSTGERDDIDRNHAKQGELEISRQLGRIGKSSRDLGTLLYENNLTAVAELCDDEFEEHVIEYSRDNSGLYLHGLNYNTIEFKTYPMERVNSFAQDWGFKVVESFEIIGFDLLWDFLTDCAKTGTYNGKEVEGFVVRTKLDENDFFFKFKFEEPYLLYRQLREVTKKYLRSNDIPAILKNTKKHRLITLQYLEFIRDLFTEKPELADEYTKGFGIVKIRKMFFDKVGLHGSSLMSAVENEVDELTQNLESLSLKEFKYVLVPVSTIGCGKTTTFQTLRGIYPNWGHVQNDDIANGKGMKNKFIKLTLEKLKESPVVLVDRNNHQFRERDQLLNDLLKEKSNYLSPEVGLKFVALNFVSEPEEKRWDVTYARVLERGDNHQSIKSASNTGLAVLVMKGFVSRLQPLDTSKDPDNMFDLVIDMKVDENSSLENAKIIVEKLKQFSEFSDLNPTDEEFNEAFGKALTYKPSFTKTFKSKKPTYYGVSVAKPKHLVDLVEKYIKDNETWKEIQTNQRVQTEFHVTLSHIMSNRKSPEKKQDWDKLGQIFKAASPKEGDTAKVGLSADLHLKRIVVWHEKLVTIEVELGNCYKGEDVIEKFPYTNTYLHITIGTASEEVKAHESNTALGKVYNKDEDVEEIKVEEVLEKQVCFIQY